LIRIAKIIKEDDPMKFSKCFLVISFCILMGSCLEDYDPHFYLNDYEDQLAAWNEQNMLDYRISLTHYFRNSDDSPMNAVIIVKNGIPETSKPPEWITSGEKSTIPEFFSFIMEEKDKIQRGGYLSAYFDPEYHYPKQITARVGEDFRKNTRSTGPDWSWDIYLRPLVEKEKEAWDNLNILDYQLKLSFTDVYEISKQAIITVKNGIPESSDPPEWLLSGKKSTIPEFFSFIKDEEEIDRSNFRVSYDHIYHYPSYIGTPFSGTSEEYYWRITLILPGK